MNDVPVVKDGLIPRVRLAVGHSSNWLQLARFGTVGGSGYVINLIVFMVLTGIAGLHIAVAAVGAFVVAVTNNFIWNRYWTFTANSGTASTQAVRFFSVSLAGLAVNLFGLWVLTDLLDFPKLPAQAVAVALSMPFSFVLNRLWTFAHQDIAVANGQD